MWKYTVQVNGMMCSMCESHINNAVRKALPVKQVNSSQRKKGDHYRHGGGVGRGSSARGHFRRRL